MSIRFPEKLGRKYRGFSYTPISPTDTVTYYIASIWYIRWYAGQEATVRAKHWKVHWFKMGKGCILSPCLFNLYTENITRNAWLDEAQAVIKIAGRNINNLGYVDDTTFMAEREEELSILLMKVKEKSEKAGLKFNIQKSKIMASGSITSWQIDGETMETVIDYFLGLQNHCGWWVQPRN